MRKVILLAVLAVALIAAPALASVQNVKISGDIDTTWLVRDQFDLGSTTLGEAFYQNLLLTQTRLRVDADLTDNVSATVALLNERVWDEDLEDGDGDSDGNNDIDLNLAYVTLREMLYSPLTVVIGRQNFAFGNSFVIDSAGSNNSVSTGGLQAAVEDLTKRTAQDAVRLTLDYNPLTIDMIASKIDANNLQGTRPHDDDVDLFGVNANYQLGDDMDTVVEAYFWAKVDQSVKDHTGDKADTVYMPGVRASTNPIKGLNTQVEIALQSGNKTNTGANDATPDNVKRRALAAQVIANYMLPFEQTSQWSPVVSGAYTYLSGDSGPSQAGKQAGRVGDEYFTGWDPMFENQGTGTIYNTLFNLTNTHIVTISAQAKPMDDVTATLEWNGMWLDKPLNDNPAGTDEGSCSGSDCITLLQPDGSSLTSITMTSDEKLGDEVGFRLAYDYTEDVQFGLRMDWFFPGNAFASDNDQVASQMILNGIVSF